MTMTNVPWQQTKTPPSSFTNANSQTSPVIAFEVVGCGEAPGGGLRERRWRQIKRRSAGLGAAGTPHPWNNPYSQQRLGNEPKLCIEPESNTSPVLPQPTGHPTGPPCGLGFSS